MSKKLARRRSKAKPDKQVRADKADRQARIKTEANNPATKARPGNRLMVKRATKAGKPQVARAETNRGSSKRAVKVETSLGKPQVVRVETRAVRLRAAKVEINQGNKVKAGKVGNKASKRAGNSKDRDKGRARLDSKGRAKAGKGSRARTDSKARAVVVRAARAARAKTIKARATNRAIRMALGLAQVTLKTSMPIQVWSQIKTASR